MNMLYIKHYLKQKNKQI